jgi:hypothetical protein
VTDFAVLQEDRQKLLDSRLVTPSIIRAATYEQLCAATISPGAALALKAAFPSAGACCGLAAATLSIKVGQGIPSCKRTATPGLELSLCCATIDTVV